MLDAFLIVHEALTGQYDVNFVLVVMPSVAYRTTFPDYDVRKKVMASSQYFTPRRGIAAQNPIRRDGTGLKFDVGQGCGQD